VKKPKDSPAHQLARAVRLILWQVRDGSQSPVAHGFKDREIRIELTRLVRETLKEGNMTLFDAEDTDAPTGETDAKNDP
jgi:hypothetical protein